MVKYQKRYNLYNQWKKGRNYMVGGEDEEACLDSLGLIYGNSAFNYNNNKRNKNNKLPAFILLCVLCCTFIFAVQFLSTSFSFFHSFGSENGAPAPLCSSVPNGTICCDRSSTRSDICIMRGDVRTHSPTSSVFLYNANYAGNYAASGPSNGKDAEAAPIQHEKIRPYTRKWETNVMSTIDELNLIVKKDSDVDHKCDVHHEVPAVFFSTGGFTGNLYHEFNDGILPLYITSQRFNKKVVFVILEYHTWWITKYADILPQLSDFPPIDYTGDKRIHCFPEAIVGLKIHDELTVDASLMEDNKTIGDFHDLLDQSYLPRINAIIRDEEREAQMNMGNSTIAPSFSHPPETTIEKKLSDAPKLVIVSRNGSRAIINEDLLVKMAEDIGFEVEVLKPQRTTELAKIYRSLNSSDVMIGVHGAAITHFLFTRPGSVFIQVIPLGTDWAADSYYGAPARKLGLRYIGYKILPRESSLYNDYKRNDPILKDPDSVNLKGWEFTKRIYLDSQNVKLDLRRFRKRLLRAYYYTITRKNGRLRSQMR